MKNLRKMLSDSRGATAIEYALIASLISVAAITAFANVGDGMSNKFNTVDNSL